MISSCFELVERLFEVSHGTIALLDTQTGQMLRYFPDSLSAPMRAQIGARAATLSGRVGQFKPLTHQHDLALVGIDSSKVFVVAPEVKDGHFTKFELKDLAYLNLILEVYASIIATDLTRAHSAAQALVGEAAPDLAESAVGPAETSTAGAPTVAPLAAGVSTAGAPAAALREPPPAAPTAAAPAELDARPTSGNAPSTVLPDLTDPVAFEAWLKGLFLDFGGALRQSTVMHHNPYRIEQAIKEAVRLGDERLLQHAFAIPVTGREGRLAPDELRSLKNHANLVNVICSRAAIDGGVSYEDAYRLSDQLFLLVESLSSCDKAFEVRYTIAHAFTLLVQQYLQQQNIVAVNIKVQQAMLYIRQHIYDKITVASVAQAVNCHRNYLQRLFKRDTTFSVVSFIRAEKLKVVKELLAHSDESVGNIAALLNFSSPSHLCTVFKEQVHLTPEQYRKSHRALG